jgi:hypothetical protein
MMEKTTVKSDGNVKSPFVTYASLVGAATSARKAPKKCLELPPLYGKVDKRLAAPKLIFRNPNLSRDLSCSTKTRLRVVSLSQSQGDASVQTVFRFGIDWYGSL